jgi:hypothetical protein
MEVDKVVRPLYTVGCVPRPELTKLLKYNHYNDVYGIAGNMYIDQKIIRKKLTCID